MSDEDDHKPLRDMANRVSLRIAVTISAVDFFFELFNIFSQMTNENRQALCSISMYGIIFFGLLSTLLTSCIAFNLLFVFVLKRTTTTTLEAIYFGITFVISFALPTLAIATGRIGWADGECWFKTTEDEPGSALYRWEWGIFYAWVLFTIVFCAVALIAVRIKLGREQAKISSGLGSGSQGRSYSDERWNARSQPSSPTSSVSNQVARRNAQKAKQMKNLVNQAISRIAWYPIVPLLSQIMNIGADADGFINGSIRWQMLVAANFGLGLMGTMNAIIFFFDPNVERWWKEVRYQYVVRHYFSRVSPEEPIPVRSRSDNTVWGQGQNGVPAWGSRGEVDSFRVLSSIELERGPNVTPQETSTFKYWIAKIFLLRSGDHARRIKELGSQRKAAAKRAESRSQMNTPKKPQNRYPPTSPGTSSFGFTSYGLSLSDDEMGGGHGRTAHTMSTTSSNSIERVAQEIQYL
ncbi:hypothetical protein HK104_000354 [Borealophlyctis nickersoniae]|nr:hypothetical protein HK104_000354 [Borealophlyctis nickersoniae]